MNTTNRTSHSSRSMRTQRGAGSLLVVIMMYVAMAIVVVFVNRNLIFEQKTSANQYRSTLAQEAAEAGLEWATAMLNRTGNISSTCTASSAAGTTTFKLKYLTTDATTGTLTPKTATGGVHAACVASQQNTGWTCSCPTPGTAPSLTNPSTTGGFLPSFAVAFVSNSTTGMVDLVSYGCTSSVTSSSCMGDAAAAVRVTLTQIPGLVTPPPAPLTARGSVSVGNAALGVINGDPNTNGVTINAGMSIDAPNARITTVPGTPPTTTLVGNDSSLRNTTEDEMFQSFFGVPKSVYKSLSTVVTLTCPCTETDVQSAYNGGARQLWLNGNLDMNSNVTIGSDSDPFVMVVDGAITMRGTIRLFGVIYSTAVTWDDTGGGSALLQGAAISEGNFTGNGTPDYYYDPNVISSIHHTTGTFVRVPGSWRDF